MTWPPPKPGLVIRYCYLWRRDALAGREEGMKDRPCAVVLAIRDEVGRARVYALPVTHSPPGQETDAIEIPSAVKKRLGLDGERSCISVTEANSFLWPGPDLRLLLSKGSESSTYGFLPAGFFRVLRDRFLAAQRAGMVALVVRTE